MGKIWNYYPVTLTVSGRHNVHVSCNKSQWAIPADLGLLNNFGVASSTLHVINQRYIVFIC